MGVHVGHFVRTDFIILQDLVLNHEDSGTRVCKRRVEPSLRRKKIQKDQRARQRHDVRMPSINL